MKDKEAEDTAVSIDYNMMYLKNKQIIWLNKYLKMLMLLPKHLKDMTFGQLCSYLSKMIKIWKILEREHGYSFVGKILDCKSHK